MRPLPGNAGAVAGLRAATRAEIAAAMTADADPQVRQRLFDRWVAELAVPLSPTVPGLRLNGVGNAMLVLETPEPLPFSRDVALTVTHRVRVQPDPPAGVPRPLLRFAAGLVFARDTVTGPVRDDVASVVSQARTLVHAVSVDRLTGTIEYRMYRVRVANGPDGPILTGDLVAVRNTPPTIPTIPPRRLQIPVDHVALLDAAGRPLAPSIPLPVEREVTVPVAILTNSAEDHALLIPAIALEPDTYTFTFSVDRPRYRADPTPYRASAAITVVIDPPSP